MDDDETATCPWCDQPSGIVCGYDTLGSDDLLCKSCGKPVEVELEEDDENVRMWLTQRRETKPDQE